MKQESRMVSVSQKEQFHKKEFPVSMELLGGLGIINWILAYVLTVWEGFRLGLSTWPVVFGTYYLVWDSFNGLFDYFNKGSFKSKYLPKRLLYVVLFAGDIGLHILFVLYGQGTPFVVTNPELIWNKVLYVALLIAMWMVVCVLCSWYGWSRDFKYYSIAIHFVHHAETIRLPAYAVSDVLMAASWISILANLCYIPKFISHSPPPKMLWPSLMFGLVVYSVICNIFRHQLCAIPTDQFIIIMGMWLVMSGCMMIFGQSWKEKKIEHKKE